MSKPQVNLVTNQRSCEEHVDLICAAWQKGVESIIETGARINVAQAEIGEGRFEAEVLPKLPFSRSTAYRLKAIASHGVLSNVAHVRLLPPSWGTLDALTRVPQTKLLSAIKSGKVHPGMARKDAMALLPKPKPEQRDDDLPPDYEGSTDPEASAEAMKAKFAAMDEPDDMPTEAEAEESYQDTLYEMACRHVEQMSDETRQRFFAHLKEKYKVIDLDDIPEFLSRAPPVAKTQIKPRQ
jgi:hypothetical protein